MKSQTKFQRELLKAGNRNLAATAVLAWIASADRGLSSTQHRLLRDFSASQTEPGALDMALAMIQSPKVGDLLAACAAVRRLPLSARKTLLANAVHIANVGKQRLVSGGMLLRFLADITCVDLSEACLAAGCPLPPVDDPSSIDWWYEHGGARPENDASDSEEKEESQENFGGKLMSLEQARSVLQIDATADESEISHAFRKLASIYHPDRHAQADPVAKKIAAKSFIEVRAAFERLTQIKS